MCPLVWPEEEKKTLRMVFLFLTAGSAICHNLTNLTNGIVTMTDTSPNSEATYSCNRGFFTNDATNRTRNENGVWTGVEPVCESKAPGTQADLILRCSKRIRKI